MISQCDFYHLNSWRIFSLDKEFWVVQVYFFSFSTSRCCSSISLLPSFWWDVHSHFNRCFFICAPLFSSEHFPFSSQPLFFGSVSMMYLRKVLLSFLASLSKLSLSFTNLGNVRPLFLHNILTNVGEKKVLPTAFTYLLQQKLICWCLTVRAIFPQNYRKTLFESISQR